MVHVEEMAVKYQNTKQYRLAFIILKLDEIKLELHFMFSFLQASIERYWAKKWWETVETISVIRHLYYYTHMLKKNIDVTYAIEFLLEHFSEM